MLIGKERGASSMIGELIWYNSVQASRHRLSSTPTPIQKSPTLLWHNCAQKLSKNKSYRVELSVCLLLGQQGCCEWNWVREHRTTNQQLLQALECFLTRINPLESGVLSSEWSWAKGLFQLRPSHADSTNVVTAMVTKRPCVPVAQINHYFSGMTYIHNNIIHVHILLRHW